MPNFLDQDGTVQLVSEIKELVDEDKAKAFQITLEASDWSNNYLECQSPNFVSTGYVYIVDPAMAFRAEYQACGVMANNVITSGKISFYCNVAPANDLTVDIVRLVADDGIPSTSFATISVTYPAGSTCTCSDGVTTLTATDTSGSFVFDLPNGGSWIITATDETYKAEKTIIAAVQGISFAAELVYHVPIAYQEVEYVTFPRGAYIDTLINASTSRKTEFRLSNDDLSTDVYYLGISSISGGSSYHISATASDTYYWGRSGGENSASGRNISTDKTVVYNDLSNGYIPLVNGDNVGSSGSDAVYNGNIQIGRRGTDARLQGNLHYFFIKNNSDSSLVFEGYPCYRKADSVVGFWDKISGSFFTNLGSGTLLAGSDV